MNPKITSNINQWYIEYDQNQFITNENWLINAVKTEDILQLNHITKEGPILDVGFYVEYYKIYIIYDNDWENPKEIFESQNTKLIENKVYEWINKYANR